MNWKRTAQNLIAAVCVVFLSASIAAAQCGHKRAGSYGSRTTYSSSYSMRTTYSASSYSAPVQQPPIIVVQQPPVVRQETYTAAPPAVQVNVQAGAGYRTPVRNFLFGAGRSGGAGGCAT